VVVQVPLVAPILMLVVPVFQAQLLELKFTALVVVAELLVLLVHSELVELAVVELQQLL
jgi:hypothetical protein